MGIIKILITLSLLITTAFVESRPISWSGGSTLMYKSNSMMSSYYYHYSPSYLYSVGAEYINDRYFNDQYINIRSTYLLDRKNTKSSQRNLYLTGAISTKKSEDFYYGIHGDWETRRYFSSFSAINKHTVSKDFSEYEMQLGVAPYLGDYNELHTWVMIKTKKDTLNNEWDTYPFLKLFKGDFLLELGTKNSHWDLHFMKRF
ncbi:MAG: hypothetical protein VW689_04765 [Gammaproteobacteria bacterium]